MPRLQTIVTNFTAGEFSPRLAGRVDLEKYNSSAEKLHNVVVLRQGGATIRPSLDFLDEVKNSAQETRPIPFVYSRTDAFVLEFGNLYVRVWAEGSLVESSPGVPLEISSPFTAAQVAEIDFTQGGDTLLLFHEDVPTQRLRRFSSTDWVMDAAPFDPPALDEIGHSSDSISLTFSAASMGAGRTVTASSALFLASDVGRTITVGGGSLTITAVSSATSATGDITTALPSTTAAPGLWRLRGTPQAELTPSDDTPVGIVITLTLDADGWRAQDVGGYVEINGGLVRIDSVSSATVAGGTIIAELTGTTAAPADSWVLKNACWNALDGYPRTGTLMQQRLWLGGSKAYPLTVWGSRTGLFYDFTPGTLDDSGVYKTVDSDENNLIQYLTGGWGTLVMLTYGTEFDMRGGIEKPITQLNAQITKRSRWGCSLCRPEDAGTDVAFIERGGTAMRVARKNDVEGFDSVDISVFSQHLFSSGIVSMSYEQKPESVFWLATGSGDLLSLTYSREQNTEAFCSGATDGHVLWLATIPEGAIDATYAIVERVIDGQTRKYMERLNWSAPPGQDSRKQVSGGPATTWAGFDHLEGKDVAVLADGVSMGIMTVSGGEITLPRAASIVSAGLPFEATIRLQAPEVGSGTGTSQGQAMSTNRVVLRLLETIGARVNDQLVAFQQFDGDVLDVAPAPFTGVKDITDTGWAMGESPLEIVQDLPYPCTVLAVVRTFTVNAG